MTKREASLPRSGDSSLVVAFGQWVALVKSESAGEVRSFRLDRVERIQETRETYEVTPHSRSTSTSTTVTSSACGARRRMCVRYPPSIHREDAGDAR
jgi:predicted DNA-binding transcriptional regulator YafY